MQIREIITQLRSVRAALDELSVTGARNAGIVAGCWSVLRDMIEKLERDAVNESAKGSRDANGTGNHPADGVTAPPRETSITAKS